MLVERELRARLGSNSPPRRESDGSPPSLWAIGAPLFSSSASRPSARLIHAHWPSQVANKPPEQPTINLRLLHCAFGQLARNASAPRWLLAFFSSEGGARARATTASNWTPSGF